MYRRVQTKATGGNKKQTNKQSICLTSQITYLTSLIRQSTKMNKADLVKLEPKNPSNCCIEIMRLIYRLKDENGVRGWKIALEINTRSYLE